MYWIVLAFLVAHSSSEADRDILEAVKGDFNFVQLGLGLSTGLHTIQHYLSYLSKKKMDKGVANKYTRSVTIRGIRVPQN